MSRKKHNLTRLSRPVMRYVDARRLVVRITADGVSMRGYRRHRWKSVTWEQIASLADEQDGILLADELASGSYRLATMGCQPGVSRSGDRMGIDGKDGPNER